jgi:hypothetical protein
MANNYHLVALRLKGTKLKIIIKLKIHAEERKLLALPLVFKKIKNGFVETENAFLTVSDLMSQIKTVLLMPLLPLLGKNVEITVIKLETENVSFSITESILGCSSKNTLIEPSLDFCLESLVGGKYNRFYLRGSSVAFHNHSLEESEKRAIEEFELVFISTLILFDGQQEIGYTKDNEEDLVAWSLRGVHVFRKKKKVLKVPKAKIALKKKVVRKSTKDFLKTINSIPHYTPD